MWSYEIRDVPGSGNCLFEAVGRSIGVDPYQLRRATVSWMNVENQLVNDVPVAKWIEWAGHKSFQVYLAQMSQAGTWGSALEISAMANMFKVPFLVYSKQDHTIKRIAEFLPKEYENTPVSVLYVGNNHYMQLLLKKT